MTLTQAQLQAIMYHAPAIRLSPFVESLNSACANAQIDTPLRMAHYLAQIAHESGELRYTEEIASGAMYEGDRDLGNTQPGDGVKFKGRGLIQITGRANYVAFGSSIHTDLTVNNAWLEVAQLPLSVVSSTWFWNLRKLNNFADEDDCIAITRRINGGLSGLADRQMYLTVAKKVLGA